MSSSARMHLVSWAFAIILIMLGAALIVVPNSAFANTLASVGTDQYGVTLTLGLTPQGVSSPNFGNKVCGSSSLSVADPTCYNMGLVGSSKDPWQVDDIGYYAPGSVFTASGTLTKNVDNSAVPNVEVDISWYYVLSQNGTQTGFTDYNIMTATTDQNGNYQTSLFTIPSQTQGNEIVIFAEVAKPAVSVTSWYTSWTCDQNTEPTTAYCFAQSPHYLVHVQNSSANSSKLTIWVGSGCQYSTSEPANTATCEMIWDNGEDISGTNEISVTLPFQIIATATGGPDPQAIFVHAKSYPVGQPSPNVEYASFPAQMGSSLVRQGSTAKMYVLYVGASTCNLGKGGQSNGCDVQLPPGRYDVEFTPSATPPWITGAQPFAVISIGSTSGIPFPTITLQQGFGIILIVFGIGVIGLVCLPRKHP